MDECSPPLSRWDAMNIAIEDLVADFFPNMSISGLETETKKRFGRKGGRIRFIFLTLRFVRCWKLGWLD